jgi:A/G-specific adenine glycosylase
LLDQTRVSPVYISISCWRGPTSRTHGTVPVLRTDSLSTGVSPTRYDGFCEPAVTVSAESGHALGGAAEVGTVLGVAEPLSDAVVEPLGCPPVPWAGPPALPGDGVMVASAVELGVADPVSAAPPPGPAGVPPVPPGPPPEQSARPRSSTTMTPPATTSRRRQYTCGDRGPTGCNTISDVTGPAGRHGVAAPRATPACPDFPPLAPTFAELSRDTLRAMIAVDALIDWYDEHARDLPWRRPEAGAWGVLVSEIMLQQTPVARVLPSYEAWLARWPTPADLAADAPGEAVRMWGKLGYPRRALRLRECAVAMVARHGGEVPSEVDTLLELPGVGAYTARAVAAFAYGRRCPVVDTNVRRVVARAVAGAGDAGLPSTTRDLAAVEVLLPASPARASRLSAALMELGQVVCTARAPRCPACPVAATCAWRLAGSPPYEGPTKPAQRFAGTDRQVRGLLMDVLRGRPDPVTLDLLDAAWHDAPQRARALDALVADGLVDPLPDGRFALPS